MSLPSVAAIVLVIATWTGTGKTPDVQAFAVKDAAQCEKMAASFAAGVEDLNRMNPPSFRMAYDASCRIMFGLRI